MRHQDERGFTLIELMIVVAMIAILSLLTVGAMRAQQPIYRLRSKTGMVMQTLYFAKSHATTTQRLVKVCIFKDDNAADDAARGRIEVLECGTRGVDGCGATVTTACQDVTAVSGTPYVTGQVTCTANTYCQVRQEDLGAGLSALENTSIESFASNNLDALEITLYPSGLVGTVGTSANMTSGSIRLTNSKLTDRSMVVQYTTTAAFRIRQSN